MVIMKMIWLLAAIVLTFEAHLGVAVKTPPSFMEVGDCAPVSLMDNFKVDQYLGNWYPVWYVPNTYVKAESCVVDTVTMPGKKMKVVTKGLASDGTAARSHAKLNFITPKNTKKKPYMQLEADLVPPVPYYIIATDYTTYSCVYSCYSLLGLRAELFWVLSRTPQISPEVQQKCFELFKRKELDVNKMERVNQEGCNYNIATSSDGNAIPEDTRHSDNSQGEIQQEVRGIREEQMGAIDTDDEDETDGSGDFPDTERTNLEPSSHEDDEGHVSKDSHLTLEEVLIMEEVGAEVAIAEMEEMERSANQLVLQLSEIVEGAPPKNEVDVQSIDANTNHTQLDDLTQLGHQVEQKEQDTVHPYNAASMFSMALVPTLMALVTVWHL